MAQSFFVTLSNAGYPQYPNLYVAQVVEGLTPGSPPPRPGQEPPLGMWGPGFPYPDQGLPGQPPYPSQGPGFPTNPIAPGGQPPYPSQGPGFPTHPIVLPDPLPPQLPGVIIPPPGQPGSITDPYPPGSVPPHAAAGLTKFYVVVPGTGVVGPYTSPPGVAGPTPPPAVPAGPPPQAPRR